MKFSFSSILLSIFSTYNINENFSKYLWIYSNLQTVIVLINYSLQHKGKSSFGFIETVSKFITVDCIHPDLQGPFPLAFTITCIYLLLTAFLFMFVLISKLLRYPKTFCDDILRVAGMLHQHVFYIPIISILTLLFRANNNNTLILLWPTGFENYSMLLPVSIVGIIFSVVFYVVTSIFSFNSSFNKISSRRPSSIDFYRLISKSALLLLYVKDDVISESGGWIVGFFILIGELGIIASVFNESPYFHHKSTEYIMKFSAANVSIIIVELLIQNEKREFILAVYWGLAFGIIFPFFRNKLKFSMQDLLHSSKTKESQAKSMYLLSIIADLLAKSYFSIKSEKNDTRNEELLFYSILAQHAKSCSNGTCFCKIYNTSSNPDVKKKTIENSFKILIDNILRDYWNAEIQINSKNAWLKITFAEMIISHNIELYPLSFTFISSINSFEQNIFTQEAIQNINNKIQEYLKIQSHDQQNNLDIGLFIDYQKQAASFREKIDNNTKLVIDFWELFHTETPDLTYMHSLSSKCNGEDSYLRAIFPILKAKYEHLFIEEQIYFAAYSILVRNSETEGMEILKEYQNRARNLWAQTHGVDSINMLTLNSHRNIILTVSMEKNHLGIITDVVGDTKEVYGFTAKELKGIKINTLMPSYVREIHDNFLLEHLRGGKKKMLYSNKFLYSVDRSGYVVPIYVYICPSPNLDAGFNYIAVIRPLKKYDDCIIINQEDNIVGYTKKIAEDFAFSANNQKKIRLVDFLPRFYDLKKVLVTCKWIKTHIPREMLSKFNYVKHQMIEYRDLRFPKGSREHLENDGGKINVHGLSLQDFYIPDTEQEYEQIIDFYLRFQTDGLQLEFRTKDGYTKYNSKISHDLNFELEPITIFSMNCLANKPSRKVSSLGDAGLNPNSSPEKIMDMMKELINHPTSKTELNASPELTKKGIKLRARANAEYLARCSARDNTVMSETSNEKSETSDFKPEIPKALDKFTKRRGSHLTLIGGQPENKRRFSKFALNTEFEIEKIKTQLESSDSEENHTNMNVKLPTKKKDQANKFVDIIEYSKIKVDDFNANHSVSSITKTKINTKRTERIINTPPKEFLQTILRNLYFIFFLSIIVILLYYQFYSGTIFQDILIILKGIKAASKRYNIFFEYNLAMRKLDMIEHGYFLEYYPGFNEDLEEQSKIQVENFVKTLPDLWPDIRNTYPILSSSEISKLVENVEIKPVNDQISSIFLPLDQAASLFQSNGLAILGGNAPEPDIQMDQVIDNILNDILVRQELFFDLLTEQLNFMINSIIDFLMYLLIAQASATALLTVMYIYIERTQIKFRTQFFEAVIRLEEKKYKPHVLKIKEFYEVAMNKTHLQSPAHNRAVKLLTKEHKNIAKPSVEKILRKQISEKNLNKSSYTRILIQTSVFIAALVSVLLFWRLVATRQKSLVQSSDNYIYANHVLGEYYLIISAIDNFVLDYEGNLRNKPIATELRLDIDYLRSNQHFYRKLDVNGDTDSEIIEIVQTNLCARYRSLYDEDFHCVNAAGGALVYGLVEMTSFVLQNVVELLDKFEATNKEEHDVELFFGNTNYYEIIEITQHILTHPFEEIAEIIRKKTDRYSSIEQDFVFAINLILLALIAGFAIISHNLSRKITVEKYETRRILNLIPISMILETPMIARYVKDYSF